MKRWFNIILVLALLGLGVSCKASRDMVLSIDGQEYIINNDIYKEIEEKVNVDEEKDYDLYLEYLFYYYGVKAVDEISLVQGENIIEIPWGQIAVTAFWRNVSKVEIDGEEYLIDQINVQTAVPETPVEYSITDIAALTAEALGISFGEKSSGFDFPTGSVDHVVWIFLDGFGYIGLETAKAEGLIPYLDSIENTYPSFGIYPPKTSTSSAALLSGLDPIQNGVWATGIRNITVPSIIDAVVDSGMQFSIIEGESTPFNYPNAEVTLSGDRNNDDSTDDNVFINAEAKIAEGVPEMLMIHFHGIDDVGHTYGPYSAEWNEKVAEVDGYIEQLIEQLPESTLILLFPDHGMHSVEGDSELGNHGNLILDDIETYIILVQK